MKFSCPKCSAKYQIGDEKVAGRTVKMKCRKCGSTIPIRAELSPLDLAKAPLVRAESLKPQPPRGRAAGGVQGAAALEFEAPAPEVAPPPPSVEWHAGIDGKTVGPMTLREIERRVGEGSINEETFVWRDGMDGWKQIPDVPELVPILTRSLRPIAAPPPSMPMQAKAQRVAPKVTAPRVPKPSPIAASPLSSREPVASHPIINEGVSAAPRRGAAVAQAAHAVSPAASDPALQSQLRASPAAAPLASSWAGALDGIDGPSSAPTLQKAAAAAPSNPLTAPEAPVPLIDMPEPVSQGLRPSYDSLVMQIKRTRKQHPLVIPFAVVAAVVFGVTIGFVLFGDQKTKIVKQIVEVPAQVATSDADEKGDKNSAASDAESDGSAAQKDGSGTPGAQPSAGSKNGAASGPSGTSASKPAEVKGLQGLSGLDGLGEPSSGPAGPGSSSAGGQPLSSSQIETTVSQYRTSVKRGCWEKALMSRDKNAPSSARVTVAISVSPSGSVTGASSSGDPKGYSGLSSCITQRIRGWTFPRSSGPTTVNVPFVFAAQ